MKICVVLALALGAFGCSGRNKSSSSTTSPTSTMNPTGGATYGGATYGGNAYGGSTGTIKDGGKR